VSRGRVVPAAAVRVRRRHRKVLALLRLMVGKCRGSFHP
jgi:hypothetical protein